MEPMEAVISVWFSGSYEREFIGEFERFFIWYAVGVQCMSRYSSFIIHHSGRGDIHSPVRNGVSFRKPLTVSCYN
jgi:hypothetical protein